jgi:hypothetical protein
MPRKRDTRQIDFVMRKFGLFRGQRHKLHDEITRMNMSLKEILEKAREIKNLYPEKWTRK